MKPKPIFIAAIKIARPYPTIDKRARRRLGILPVTTRRTVTTNPQVSLINQPRLVTFEQSPAAAVAHFVPMVRHKHVQHLSRTNPTTPRPPNLFLPILAEMRRQRFTRRHAQTQTRTIELHATAMAFEQQVVNDRNAEEDRGPLFLKQFHDHVRRRLRPTKNRSRAVQKWKRKTVAQPIRKRQA